MQSTVKLTAWFFCLEKISWRNQVQLLYSPLVGALPFSNLQQEAPGRCPLLQRREERPRAPPDPAEAVGAEEPGEPVSQPQSAPFRRHAGGCGHGLPVGPALLLPQLLPV